jgi:DNA (cytosine-5)-methyltransferase 1
MEHFATRLEELGFAWAYRVVDCAFGAAAPSRVIVLASRTEDPRPACSVPTW